MLRAVPDGSRRIQGRHAVLWYETGLMMLPQFARLRADRQDSVIVFARLLAGKLSRADGTTFHSRAARCEAAARSETTWKAVRRLLARWGCLGTVYEGCKRYDGTETRRDAAVYVLCLPRAIIRKIAARRKLSRSRPLTRPPTGEPEVSIHVPDAVPAERPGGPPSGRAGSRGGPRNAELAAGSEAARAMARVIRQAAGKDLTDGWVGYWVRKLTVAGWTPADLAEAVQGPPAGRLHGYAPKTVRRPAGLLWWLLSPWTGPDGRMLASPSQARAAAAAAAAAQNEPLRADHRAPGTDPVPHVEAILRAQGWRRPPAARPPRETSTEG